MNLQIQRANRVTQGINFKRPVSGHMIMKYQGTRNKGNILKACKERFQSANKGLGVKIAKEILATKLGARRQWKIKFKL